MSIGASRGNLIRQLITEALLLSVTAGALGLLLATWFRSILWSLRPPFLQQTPIDLSFDWRVLGFTFLLAVVTGVLFGLVPAVRATRPELVGDLKEGQREGSGRRFGLREALVLIQLALSFVALIGAGLFLRSLGAAAEVDLGFNPTSLVSMDFNVGANGYEPAQGKDFYDRLVDKASAVPGVEAAELSTSVPMVNQDFFRSVFLQDAAKDDERNGQFTAVATITDGFFKTLEIDLVSGRTFDARDHAEAALAVVVNEAMARQTWGEEDPVGRRFHFFDQDEQIREVVGVVENAKFFTVGEEPQAITYMPRDQNYKDQMSLVAKVSGDPDEALATLRKELQPLDPALPIVNEQKMQEAVGQSLWAARMAAGLLGLLGVLALVLAAIGLYGVMSHAVSQRSRELGIRMAMGADNRSVLAMVMRRGMLLAVLGLVLGCALSLFVSRGLTSLLYGISPSDIRTYGSTFLVLLLVAVMANLMPAWRATRIDPVKVLRSER
jgi:predicted permease